MSTKSDGSVYEGDFRYEKRDGQGVFTYKSGSRYEGDWKGKEKSLCVNV